jgi:hypothetical protein
VSLEIRPGAGFQMGTLHAQVPRSLIGKWARRGLKGKRSGRSLPNLECLFKLRLSILQDKCGQPLSGMTAFVCVCGLDLGSEPVMS